MKYCYLCGTDLPTALSAVGQTVCRRCGCHHVETGAGNGTMTVIRRRVRRPKILTNGPAVTIGTDWQAAESA